MAQPIGTGPGCAAGWGSCPTLATRLEGRSCRTPASSRGSRTDTAMAMMMSPAACEAMPIPRSQPVNV